MNTDTRLWFLRCAVAGITLSVAMLGHAGEGRLFRRPTPSKTPEIMMASPLIPLHRHGAVAASQSKAGTNLGVQAYPWGYFGAQPTTMGSRHIGYNDDRLQWEFIRAD